MCELKTCLIAKPPFTKPPLWTPDWKATFESPPTGVWTKKPFARALATQASGRNCNPAPELVLSKLIFQPAFISGGVYILLQLQSSQSAGHTNSHQCTWAGRTHFFGWIAAGRVVVSCIQCVYIYIYTHTYIYIYIYICIYTYIHMCNTVPFEREHPAWLLGTLSKQTLHFQWPRKG